MLDGLHGEGLLTEARTAATACMTCCAATPATTPPAWSDDAGQAVGRLLDYYPQTAARADALLARQTRPAPPRPRLHRRGSLPPWPRTPGRRWPGPAPNAPACSPASITPPRERQHARVTALTAALAELLRRDGP